VRPNAVLRPQRPKNVGRPKNFAKEKKLWPLSRKWQVQGRALVAPAGAKSPCANIKVRKPPPKKHQSKKPVYLLVLVVA